MDIEGISGDRENLLDGFDNKKEGSDGQRTYIILESGRTCSCMSKGMARLGIEEISFQVYQLAEEKFFDMNFRYSISGGAVNCLQFSREVLSKDNREFFSKVEAMAGAAGIIGLAVLANRAGILASSPQRPRSLDSDYFRCMEGCDRIDFEPIKLLCWAWCTFFANKENGS